MRILIGTPIHISKDYCMERWLENVATLEYPADLLLVDNSPDTEYVKKVKRYCKNVKIKNYKIEHVKVVPSQEVIKKGVDEQIHERICRSREIIRHYVVDNDYDAWFCWESDQIIPTNALDKLVTLMKTGDFMVVDHNCWVNTIPDQINFDFGVTLLTRECLQKYSFIPTFGTGPNESPSWYEAEHWYRNRLRRDQCNFIEVAGLIEPIYHLDK